MLPLHFLVVMPLPFRLIELSILLKILTLRVLIGLSLGSTISLVIELIRWVEFLISCLLLLLVALLRIMRQLGLIEKLRGNIWKVRLVSRIRNEDRSRISDVWGNVRNLLLSILEKGGSQLGWLGVNGLICPLSSEVIVVPVRETILLQVRLQLNIVSNLIVRS